jgi:hypothetical protein
MRVFLGFVLSSVSLFGAAASLSYADLDGGRACCLAQDDLGNTYVVGSVVSATGTRVSVTKLDGSNHVVFKFTFGGGLADQPNAVAMDSRGNLVIAGETSYTDFPIVSALIPQTAPGVRAGFITKVNPSSGEILFSTRIGGQAADNFASIGTTVNAVTVDVAGNISRIGDQRSANQLSSNSARDIRRLSSDHRRL